MVRTTQTLYYGPEPKTWDESKSYNVQILNILNWYNYTGDTSKRSNYVKQYLKQYPFVSQSDINKIPDSFLSNYPYIMRMVLNNIPVEESTIEKMKLKINRLIIKFSNKQEKKVINKDKRDKIGDYLGEMDPILDGIQDGKITKWSVNSSVNLSAPEKNQVRTYFTNIKEELEWAIDTNAEEYTTSKVVMRRMIKFCEEVIESVKNKQGVRKPRVKTKEQQVKNIKYKETLKVGLIEYKSFKPEYIIGSQLVFVYNTKNKMLYRFTSTDGLSVKNTRIVDYNSNSTGRRLRKPDEILPLLKGKSTNKLNKIFDGLTTKDMNLVDRTHDNLLLVHCL